MIKGVEDMRWLTLNTKWIRINSKVGVPMAPVFSVRESLASLHGRNQIHLVPISIGWCVGIRKGSKWRARPHPMNRNTTSSATQKAHRANIDSRTVGHQQRRGKVYRH